MKNWLYEAKDLFDNDTGKDNYIDKAYVVTGKSEGFIKHAFILSYYYLLKATACDDLTTFHYDCLREIVKLGGDTDTNACIACGMIGAIVG